MACWPCWPYGHAATWDTVNGWASNLNKILMKTQSVSEFFTLRSVVLLSVAVNRAVCYVKTWSDSATPLSATRKKTCGAFRRALRRLEI